jgi:hypothetical protein
MSFSLRSHLFRSSLLNRCVYTSIHRTNLFFSCPRFFSSFRPSDPDIEGLKTRRDVEDRVFKILHANNKISALAQG